ncbi:MAG: hypothetical protein ACLGGX_04910 [Bdellovibrionia bacterium]
MTMFVVLISALFFQSIALSMEQPKIYSVELDGLVQKDGKGLYDEVLKKMKIQHQTVPPKRAELRMLDEKACMFPVDRKMIDTDIPLIQSDALLTVNIFLFSLNKKYNSLEELKNKSLGVRSSINFGKEIHKRLKKLKVNDSKTLEQNLAKLRDRRVEAILEFEEDIAIFLKNNPDFKINLTKGALQLQFDDALTCVDTPSNRSFMKKFNDLLHPHRLMDVGLNN